MNLILKQYKNRYGEVDFPSLFTVPSTERITQMAVNDFRRTNLLVIAALTMAFETMNVKRGMNAIQILDLAEYVIDSASDDNLSFEDLMMFLQNMVLGKYELAYESMDIPKFMRTLEIYRQQRHLAVLEYRENHHLQYKALGDATRTTQRDPLAEHFATFGERISALKDQIQYERNINLKDIDKF